MDTRTANGLGGRKDQVWEFDTQDNYPTGIVDRRINKVFSPTLATLIWLGASDLCILREDNQALRDECINHFPEDFLTKA